MKFDYHSWWKNSVDNPSFEYAIIKSLHTQLVITKAIFAKPIYDCL